MNLPFNKKFKIFWYLLPLVFIAWFSIKYFILTPPKHLKKSSIYENETKKLAQSTQVSQINSEIPSVEDKKIEDKKIEDEIDQIDRDWNLIARKIFSSDKEWKIYNEIRLECEEKQMQAYEEFHRETVAKNKGKLRLSLSEDQSQYENEINDGCLKKLQDVLGVQIVQKYVQALDQFNQELLLKDRASLQVEF